MKKCRTLVSVSLLLCLILFLFSSCGSSGKMDGAYYDYDAGSYYYAPAEEAEYWEEPAMTYAAETAAPSAYADYNAKPGSSGKSTEYSTQSSSAQTPAPNQPSAADNRKIIRTENISLETKNFDETVSGITESAEKLGGYIENSYISGQSMNSYAVARSASFTLRIPSSALDEYVDYVSETYYVTSRTTNASDITDRYYDAEARLNSLLTQEERLLAMLEGANDLEYMLKLEDKLSEVRYQIESYYSTLSRLDKQVALSTVCITLQEVIEYQPVSPLPQTFGERFANAVRNSWKDFGHGLQDFAIDFMYSLPGLLLFLLIVAIVILIIRAIVRHTRKKRQLKAEKAAQAQAQLAQLRQNEDMNAGR